LYPRPRSYVLGSIGTVETLTLLPGPFSDWTGTHRGNGMGAKRKSAGPQLRLTKARLDDLVEEALVDAYGESEQVTAFYTMIENNLRLPFETELLGMTVTVQGIDVSEDDQLVAVCRKNKSKQRISLSELPLPAMLPKGAEWIAAYRYWRTGKIR